MKNKTRQAWKKAPEIHFSSSQFHPHPHDLDDWSGLIVRLLYGVELITPKRVLERCISDYFPPFVRRKHPEAASLRIISILRFLSVRVKGFIHTTCHVDEERKKERKKEREKRWLPLLLLLLLLCCRQRCDSSYRGVTHYSERRKTRHQV